jgi:DNA-directed RNA polymerase beta subunit
MQDSKSNSSLEMEDEKTPLAKHIPTRLPHDPNLGVMTKKNRSSGVRVADVFFKSNSFVGHHLSSYAHFSQSVISDTITETVPFDHENDQYRFTFQYKNIYLGAPSVIEHDGSVTDLWPNQARLRDLTYSAPLFVQVPKVLTRKLLNDTISSEENVFVGMLPIMIMSSACRLHNATEAQLIAADECIYEQGGYFIVKGHERILMGMERMCTDHVYIFPNKHNPEDLYAEVSSLEERAKKAPSQFSIHILPSNTLGKKSLRACSSYFKKEFPLGILFKALGVTKGIKDMILKRFLFTKLKPLRKRQLEELVDGIEEESFHILDQDAAYTALAKIGTSHISGEDKGTMYVEAVLEKEFLPRIGIDKSTFHIKARFLCHMVQKLLQVLFGLRPHDDHDHEKNKRTDESGPLLATIFRQSWGKINRELQIMIRKKIDGGAALKDIMISQLINTLSLSKDMCNALATGNWSAVRNSRMKTGVSQPLNRFNRQATLSHCRRNINPMPKNSVLSKPRQVHSSMWGVTCPFESPEGPGIGLVKNKALMCCVSIGFSDIWIVELIHAQKLTNELSEQTPWIVFVNGKIQGYDANDSIYWFIRNLKLQGTLPMYTSISIDRINREIYVWTDSGRKCRPLLLVENGKIKMDDDYLKQLELGEKTWEEAIGDGMIEMVDGAEQENLLVAVKKIDLERDGLKYTHAEMSDAFIIGTCASIIPYGNSDPSARLAYQCLWQEEPVLMSDSTYLKIGDIVVGDEVMTFNPDTFEVGSSKVISTLKETTNKRVYRITTISGRTIVATEDHKFMTSEGWKEVKDFDKAATKLAVSTRQLISHSHTVPDKKIILDKTKFTCLLEDTMRPSTLKLHAETAPLPLSNDSSLLPILARMFGFLILRNIGICYDGQSQLQITASNSHTIELFEEDVKRLGFQAYTPTKLWHEIHGEICHVWHVRHTGPIVSLFIALGLSVRSESIEGNLMIPEWIMNGSAAVKCEFLAGFQGRNGHEIQCNGGLCTNFVCDAVLLSAAPKHAESQRKFCSQICTLFGEFQITAEVVSAHKKRGRERIGIRIANNAKNLLRFYDSIGYRYDICKIQESGLIAEYIRYRALARPITPALDSGKISRGKRMGSFCRKIYNKMFGLMSLKKWRSEVTWKMEHLFIPIQSVELTNINKIADITTESSNHSFFAGDLFCVHNSSMSKQAASLPVTNINKRMDGMSHILWYPQKPICQTVQMDQMNYNDLPAGQNFVIALITNGGLDCFSPCRIEKGYGKSALSWQRS